MMGLEEAEKSPFLFQPLVIEEEKCLLFSPVNLRQPHRAANFAAIQIVTILRAGLAANVVAEIVRVQVFIAEIVIQPAVKLAGARIRHNRHR